MSAVEARDAHFGPGSARACLVQGFAAVEGTTGRGNCEGAGSAAADGGHAGDTGTADWDDGGGVWYAGLSVRKITRFTTHV